MAVAPSPRDLQIELGRRAGLDAIASVVRSYGEPLATRYVTGLVSAAKSHFLLTRSRQETFAFFTDVADQCIEPMLTPKDKK